MNATTFQFKASPARLRNGSWGVRVNCRLQPGDVITVTAKSGKKWCACIERIIASGADWCLCAVRTDIAEPMDRDF